MGLGASSQPSQLLLLQKWQLEHEGHAHLYHTVNNALCITSRVNPPVSFKLGPDL